MNIMEYINKNLPNLNWNILPQLFEDEGVKLTEEIKTYLKETPNNINWDVFGSLGENEELITITFEYNQKILGTTSGLKGEEIQLPAFMDVCNWYADSIRTIFIGSEGDLYTLDSNITLYGDLYE